jgi:hypothetical protein
MDDNADVSLPQHADLAPPPPPPPPPLPRRKPLLGRRSATAALAGGLVVGGIAGGYVITQAATPSPSATATPGASANPPAAAPAVPAVPGHPGGDCGPGGGPGAQAEDQQVVATALGLTTTQLQTEETAGKTIAAMAKEHNVDVNKVITAWVASENAEIDKRVSSGQITATQGAQEKTSTTQRVTAEVNGTRPADGPPDGAADQR